jgi:thiamine-phosphate pyrophosphorylase
MDAALLPSSALGAKGASEVTFAAMLAESGIKLIQYRDKKASARRLFDVSSQLLSALRGSGCRVVVNDRADIAALAGAGGVHVGQEDLPVEDARRMCGAGRWVGISTHDLEQVRAAAETSADYVAVGPVFATQTKETPEPVVGVEFIQKARGVTRKPLVAIGGITLETARAVYAAGAHCIAVARDVICDRDAAHRVRQYLLVARESGAA